MTAARPPRSFNPDTGQLVDADGNAHTLSDEEMAQYWWTEAIAANKADAPEAAAHAHAKSDFYRHRAKAAKKAKVVERKPKK